MEKILRKTQNPRGKAAIFGAQTQLEPDNGTQTQPDIFTFCIQKPETG